MKIVFDRVECPRCGGSGQMPFSVRGGICFKCEGSGQVRTAAGRRAYAKMLEVQKEICSVPASSLKPGDRIIDSMGKVRTVKDIDVSLGRGNVSGPDFVQYGKSVVVCKGYSMSMPAHASVKKAWTTESLAICAERLKNFKGAKVVA